MNLELEIRIWNLNRFWIYNLKFETRIYYLIISIWPPRKTFRRYNAGKDPNLISYSEILIWNFKCGPNSWEQEVAACLDSSYPTVLWGGGVFFRFLKFWVMDHVKNSSSMNLFFFKFKFENSFLFIHLIKKSPHMIPGRNNTGNMNIFKFKFEKLIWNSKLKTISRISFPSLKSLSLNQLLNPVTTL